MSKTTKAKATTTAKAVPASKAKSLTEVNTANLKKVAKNVTPGDSALTKLKYHYPADCDTKEKRKAFRVKARSQAEKLQKALDVAIKSKNDKDIKKAIAQREARWKEEIGYKDKDVVDAYLALSTAQKKIIRETIIEFSKVK